MLLASSIPVPRTHSIAALLDLLPDGLTIPSNIEGAAILTDYAVSSRYPVDVEPVNEGEYQEAVLLAEAVVTWAEAAVQKC